MKTKAILIVTHGSFGKELLRSVEMIMGEQKDVVALGLNLADDVESLRTDVKKIVDENQRANRETIVIADLFGGSPSNVALSLLKDYDVRVMVGINMPMLMEVLSSRDDYGIEELTEISCRAGVNGIKKVDVEMLNQQNR